MTIKHIGDLQETVSNGMNANLIDQTEIRIWDLPGMPWIIFALYIGFLTAARPVLVYWGAPLPIRLINHVGTALTFTFLSFGIFRYVFKQNVTSIYTKAHLLKIKLWFINILIMLGYGLFIKNELITIVSDFIIYFYMGMFLLIGGDDRLWVIVTKHLTILFYATVLLMFLFIDVPMANFMESNLQSDPISIVTLIERYTTSVSYSLRPLIYPGLLLGMWGLVIGNHKFRMIQVGTWLFFFLCEVGFFKFRSSAIFLAIAIFSFLFLRPRLEKSRRIQTTIALTVCTSFFIMYYTTTEYWALLEERYYMSSQGAGIFFMRISELIVYINEMNWSILWGRGMGGTYDASTVFWGAYNWATIHIGALIFTLKGGLPFFALFLSFLFPIVKHRDTSWYQNPCNLTASLLVPVYLIYYMVNPIFAGPESVFFHLPIFTVLSRFGKKIGD